MKRLIVISPFANPDASSIVDNMSKVMEDKQTFEIQFS